MDTNSSVNDPRVAAQIRKARAGDRQAWDDLLNSHRRRLRRVVAWRLNQRLRGRLDASDVIQETFLDATKGLEQYAERAEMPFFLWLRWLAGMKLATLYRKHLACQVRDAAREVSVDRDVPGGNAPALAARLLGRQTSASEVAMRSERKARIRELLDTMDPVDREVIVLRHFEELSNAEAARVLGLQEAAASKRYIRALRRLKHELRVNHGGSAEFRP